MLSQFKQALTNILAVVHAAGGEASDIVRLTAYLVDLDAYRSNLRGFGLAYREVMGKHFPAMAFVGASGLVEPRALVEIEATAVLAEKP
jgi:enamine deaminase RidA (YjgF/YER057c/UK114 family)